MQTVAAQIETTSIILGTDANVIVQATSAQIVQPLAGQMTKILELTSLCNHIEILCRCKSSEERLFYVLYANKEHLSYKEMQRCISNQTYTALLNSKNNMSKGLL